MMGFSGPARAHFFMLSFVSLCRFWPVESHSSHETAELLVKSWRVHNICISGAINWKIGLLMGVAQFIGARIGAGMAMKNGAKIIKPLLIIVCLALATKLLLDGDNPVRVWLSDLF